MTATDQKPMSPDPGRNAGDDEAQMEFGSERKAGRGAYHHGKLRDVLIDAAWDMILEQGAERFSLADACRRAGVSTAAPYKHFRDRDEIFEIVVQRGFDRMTDQAIAEVRRIGEGTRDGVVEMLITYYRFATAHPSIFRLMFGQQPAIKCASEVIGSGRSGCEKILDQIRLFCVAEAIDADPMELFIPSWTFIHGAACLTIDEDYACVAPGVDVEDMLRRKLPLLLAMAGGDQSA
ncbi:MAG: TetR/AcrR family transcriptional regulator [Hyphomicrobiaceae bacterium]